MTQPPPDPTDRIIAAQRAEAAKTRALLAWIFLGVPAAGVIVWLVLLAVNSHSPAGDTSNTGAPVDTAPFTISGVFQFAATADLPDGHSCSVDTPNVVSEGSPVFITDQDGNNLATGQVQAGTWVAADQACEFAFRVTDVPGGKPTYEIGVGEYGPVQYDATLVQDGPMTITADQLEDTATAFPTP